MFDLEQAIANWRQRMLAAGIQSPVPLEELESHLREEIEQQMESGLEPQAALAVAIEKVGQAQNLKAEFTKVDRVKKLDRLEKLTSGICAVMFLVYIVPRARHLLFDDDFNWAWRLALLANISLAVMMFGLQYMVDFFPVIPNQRTRWAIGASFWIGEMGIALFLYHISPHLGLSSGAHFMFTMWLLILVFMGGVIRYGLEEAAKRATMATDS